MGWWHMLKLLGSGWCWLVTATSRPKHPTMYIMKPKEWTWYLMCVWCACAAVLTTGMLPIQPVDDTACLSKVKCALSTHYDINSNDCLLKSLVKAPTDRSEPWWRRPFIIRLRNISFGLSVKLRQFDGGGLHGAGEWLNYSHHLIWNLLGVHP